MLNLTNILAKQRLPATLLKVYLIGLCIAIVRLKPAIPKLCSESLRSTNIDRVSPTLSPVFINTKMTDVNIYLTMS